MNRYAVYFTPPPGPLAEATAAWLGWDGASGQTVPHPEVAGLPIPVAEITATPRKYSFHATLKPPFRLAEGTTAEGLKTAVESLAADLAPVTMDAMLVTHLGRFLALTPQGDPAALNAMAARVVQELDSFRAPLTEEDRTRRLASGLSERQKELLELWGYPYVLEEFRCHMTLSGALPPEVLGPTKEVLTRQIEPLAPKPFTFDALTILGQADDGMFHHLHRIALSG